MRSDHRFRATVGKLLVLLIVVSTIDIVLLLSLTGIALASDTANSAYNLVFNNPNGVNTTTTVTSFRNPSQFGETVTFTATVDAGVLVTVTSGVVTFTIDSTVVTTTVVPGAPATASYVTSSLGVGLHTVQAQYYDETGNFNSSSDNLESGQTVNKADTTTTLASSNPNSVFGETVWFTATVSVTSPGAGTPTGSVQFYDNGSPLGLAQPLTSSAATLVTTTLSVASHPITATYLSDANFSGSTSSPLTQVVTQANTTTELTSSVNPAVFGQSVTFTATVNATSPGAGTPTGSVQFYGNSSPLGGTQSLSGGKATLITSTLSVASHPITATYLSDANFSGSTSSPLTQVVTQANTTTELTSSVNPAVFGQSVTFTATVSATPPGNGTPSGNVQFYDNGLPLGGTQSLSGGKATLITSTLSVASHPITATYLSDANFSGSTSSPLTQVVTKANTTTALASSNPNSVFGETVWFTATVSVTSPGAGTPTGSVQFYDNGSPLGGTQSLSGGKATLITSTLSVASHPITTTYSSDANFNGSTSSPLTQVVTKANTTTALSSSVNPAVFGQSVTITATVSATPPGNGTPSGNIQFYDNGSPLGLAQPLTSSTATLVTTTLSVASHPITATYLSDANFNGSTSSPLTQVVTKANTTTALSSSVNPSVFGQSVTFTATVNATLPGAGTPTGSVQFYDNGSPLGLARPLTSSTATF
ncbi:MAG: Ig-like domain repeat protein [Chloroflexi bacterium]|nr:Ig-like domain repeat protein [Chloroflexota bacterium]